MKNNGRNRRVVALFLTNQECDLIGREKEGWVIDIEMRIKCIANEKTKEKRKKKRREEKRKRGWERARGDIG